MMNVWFQWSQDLFVSTVITFPLMARVHLWLFHVLYGCWIYQQFSLKIVRKLCIEKLILPWYIYTSQYKFHSCVCGKEIKCETESIGILRDIQDLCLSNCSETYSAALFYNFDINCENKWAADTCGSWLL